MKNAEKILSKKYIFKEEMDKIMPKAQSDDLWHKASKKLEELLIRYSSLPKGVHIHSDERILPSAAVYLTLRDEIGREKAYQVIENGAVRGCISIEAKLQKLMNLPGMPNLFIRMWDPLVKRVFGPDNGFQNTFYPGKKGEYRMDVTACPYCRITTELGCPEITGIFCDNDERIYGGLPGIKFERSSTLGKGADRCDFHISRK